MLHIGGLVKDCSNSSALALSQRSKTWDSKCLALITQMVKAFGMNLKGGGSSPPMVETFPVSKTLPLSQEYLIVCRK